MESTKPCLLISALVSSICSLLSCIFNPHIQPKFKAVPMLTYGTIQQCGRFVRACYLPLSLRTKMNDTTEINQQRVVPIKGVSHCFVNPQAKLLQQDDTENQSAILSSACYWTDRKITTLKVNSNIQLGTSIQLGSSIQLSPTSFF